MKRIIAGVPVVAEPSSTAIRATSSSIGVTEPTQMPEFVTVDIHQGKLRGKRVTSSTNGVTYYSFQGIPYAKPPVGSLRFKPPEEPEPWTGTRDALVEGAVSLQLDLITKKLVGDEDCLFLNVYTPQWPPTSPKAVMVWIHGGGFYFGSGNTDMYGPDFLVTEDVVLVTINYRLVALGFLYLEGADITGNNGLRDQVMALKWVKNNISQFGGDPDNVTIFGESAGGISVNYLMLSPSAAGLFHKAIPQSGTARFPTCNIPHDICSQRAVRLALSLGCTSENPQEIADFLRTVPAEMLVANQYPLLSEKERGAVITIDFFPSEEVGSNAFLPGSTKKLLEEGQFTKVPLMTGVTSAEGKLLLSEEIMGSKKLSDIHQQIESLLPLDLDANIVSNKAKKIKKFYFGEKDFNEETIIQYIDMLSDLLFVYPACQIIQAQVRWSLHPTYVYLFDHVSSPGVKLLPTARDDLPGAPHVGELPYLFQSSTKPNIFTPGSPDAELLGKFVKLWTNFAKFGNPSNDAVNVIWIPATTEKKNFLKINGGFNMDSDMYKQRMDFLEQLLSNDK